MKRNYFILGLMLLSISTFTVAQTDPGTTNLTHKWTFDDGTADDNVGTVHGTLMDAAEVIDGQLNLAGGYVELNGSDLAINTYSELTVSAWYQSEAGMNTGFHFLYYFGGQNGTNGANMTGYTPARGSDANNHGDLSRVIISTGDGEIGVDGFEYDDGLLHHMVCTIDATTITYYIDGILLGSTPIGASSLASVASDLAYFGKGGWSQDPTWTGKIDEISIYDKVLTADNVKFLYDLKKPAIAAENPGTANLTHQWTFDDGTATDVVRGITTTLMDGAVITDKALDTSAGGYVELDGAALAVNSYSALSVEAWFTSIAGANTSFHFLYYFGNSDGGGQNFTGYTPARGNDVSRIMISTGDGEKGLNGTEYDDGLLHHVVCVIDATTVYYYIDGILLGSASIGANALANVGTDFAWMAKGGWDADQTWYGLLSKMSVYDTALTAGNVKYLFAQGAENGGAGIQAAQKLTQSVSLNNNQLVAQFESSSATKGKIEVYNVQGKLISSNSFAVNAGTNRKALNAGFATGVYVVKLVVGTQSTYTKIVK
ncbi:MAG TPA: LamG-like jellyroll fold domain-containing protein [Paludibacter sp.]